ncbi:hypothetical protein B0E46_15740 [Rhodanobacter sp. B04]|uniref:hypothetical protein n=1 Tax=Rhodanobacter sp. B04 TaxID=1945860 RepID=UPI0009854D2C|nr:hypothetical protein [Rhodanobacter sp. B04]OOG61429.1 hypothetical protein B0E46_15740 [Rhodanobacter sp. B04]
MAYQRHNPEYVPPGMNAKLLAMRVTCKYHRRMYNANHMLAGRIEAAMCPRCLRDQEWARQAKVQMEVQGEVITAESLLAKAEELSGYRLARYHHG